MGFKMKGPTFYKSTPLKQNIAGAMPPRQPSPPSITNAMGSSVGSVASAFPQKDLTESYDTDKAKKADAWKTGKYVEPKDRDATTKTKKNILTGKTRKITRTTDSKNRKTKTVDKYDRQGNLIKTKQKRSDGDKKVVKYKKGRTITTEKATHRGETDKSKTYKTHDVTKGSDKGTFVKKSSRWGLSGGEYEGGAGANSRISSTISKEDFKKGKKGAHVGSSYYKK